MYDEGFTAGHGVHHWHSIDTLNSGLVAPQDAPASATGSAGYAYLNPLMVRDQVVVKKLWVACSTTGTNLDIGLYDVAFNLLVSSGSQTHPAAATEFVYDCTDTLISPGIYYFGVVWLGGSGSGYYIPITNALGSAFGAYYDAGGNSSLPNPFTSVGGTNRPWIGGILINTVVS